MWKGALKFAVVKFDKLRDKGCHNNQYNRVSLAVAWSVLYLLRKHSHSIDKIKCRKNVNISMFNWKLLDPNAPSLTRLTHNCNGALKKRCKAATSNFLNTFKVRLFSQKEIWASNVKGVWNEKNRPSRLLLEICNTLPSSCLACWQKAWLICAPRCVTLQSIGL